MNTENINKMDELDFITYIICTVCDYAKANCYPITDTVKTIGQNLVFLAELSTFDNWEGVDQPES